MKKLFLSVAALLTASIMFGQQASQPENTNKTSSTDILPVSGDWGLSIGAGTALNYLGNFFGKNVANANAAMFNFANKNYPLAVVAGKYFLADDKAVRVSACFYYNNNTTNIMIHDDTNLDPDAYVYDKAKTNNSGYTIAAGLEKRRGYNRLQGIYGGEVFLGKIGKNNFDYEYGNKYSQVNTAPTSTNFAQTTTIPKPSWGHRLTSDHTSSVFSCGARAFAGVEYFVAQKISLGGEFYFGLQYQNTSKQVTTWEYYNTVLNEIKSETIESKSNKAFNIGLNNVGANLNLNFYF